ncbi:hypothetical protein G7046_g1983 [Stylonectria norvegica]|nr:hypothetical protein G7046_g1983 [Stylonectria norvegica]
MQGLFASLLLAGSAIALPTLSISSRSDEPSCMAKGAKATHWNVEKFDYHASYIFSTPSHQIASGSVNFTLVNPVNNYKSTCTADSTQLDDFFYGNFEYHCDVPVPSDSASFTFSRPSGELKINQTWACPEEGGRFEAKGGATLKLDCKEYKWENPHWKDGQLFSQRIVTCKPATVKAEITEISAVL